MEKDNWLLKRYYNKNPQMKRQEEWRQKQIEVYYKMGRPLFKIRKY